MGFIINIPFPVIDWVVWSVLMSLGMRMLLLIIISLLLKHRNLWNLPFRGKQGQPGNRQHSVPALLPYRLNHKNKPQPGLAKSFNSDRMRQLTARTRLIMKKNGFAGEIRLRVPARYSDRDGQAKANDPVEPECPANSGSGVNQKKRGN